MPIEERLQDAARKEAFLKGKTARINGRPKTANPYAISGFGLLFRSAWDRGWTTQNVLEKKKD